MRLSYQLCVINLCYKSMLFPTFHAHIAVIILVETQTDKKLVIQSRPSPH